MRYLYIEGINPEPWTAPDIAVGRRNGKPFPMVHKNGRLRAFQDAIRECIAEAYPDIAVPTPGTRLRVTFLFWRQMDSYTTETGRTASRNVADVTNMQKALEDALQGILFKNDRDIKSVNSLIVAEGADVRPCIIVVVDDVLDERLPSYSAMRSALAEEARPTPPGNVYFVDGAL